MGRPQKAKVMHCLLTWRRGGVRGIVELRILEALEAELHVPLQRFFDQVVGTR